MKIDIKVSFCYVRPLPTLAKRSPKALFRERPNIDKSWPFSGSVHKQRTNTSSFGHMLRNTLFYPMPRGTLSNDQGYFNLDSAVWDTARLSNHKVLAAVGTELGRPFLLCSATTYLAHCSFNIFFFTINKNK
jgi:hypothetical protein